MRRHSYFGRWAVASVLALVGPMVGASGCGGEGEDRLSSAEFEERGNDVCRRYRQTIAAALNDLGDGRPTAEEAQRVAIDAIVPAQRVQLERLQELVPPSDIAEEYEDFLTETEEAVETLAEWAEEDPARLLEDDPFPQFDDRAAELGLTACGSS